MPQPLTVGCRDRSGRGAERAKPAAYKKVGTYVLCKAFSPKGRSVILSQAVSDDAAKASDDGSA